MTPMVYLISFLVYVFLLLLAFYKGKTWDVQFTKHISKMNDQYQKMNSYESRVSSAKKINLTSWIVLLGAICAEIYGVYQFGSENEYLSSLLFGAGGIFCLIILKYLAGKFLDSVVKKKGVELVNIHTIMNNFFEDLGENMTEAIQNVLGKNLKGRTVELEKKVIEFEQGIEKLAKENKVKLKKVEIYKSVMEKLGSFEWCECCKDGIINNRENLPKDSLLVCSEKCMLNYIDMSANLSTKMREQLRILSIQFKN